MRARRSEQSGFTLVEVMLALGIVFAGLVLLINATARNIHDARRAQMMGVATDLARGKMYDIEEELLKEGFQDTDEEEDGDFSDEGWKKITWDAKVEKVELPGLPNLEALTGTGEEGEDGAAAGPLANSPLAGLIGMGGGDAAAAQGASVLSSQFELIKQVLEASVRKVTLTIKWKIGREEEKMVVVAYFTDPAQMSRVIRTGGLPDPSSDPSTDPPPRGN